MSNDTIQAISGESVGQEANKHIEDLTIKSIEGDKDALCKLCEEIAKNVLFRTKYILNNETDAEDVAQEVLIRVCENIRSLRSPKAFKAWLGGIIMNESKRHMAKSAKKGTVVDIDDYIETFEDNRVDAKPQGYVENNEMRTAVLDILKRLPLRQREAVMLHYFDELNIVEVAQAMSITKQNASKYLSLAREKLKGEIEKAPVGSKLGAMAAVPVGVMIGEALCTEAIVFIPANAAWIGGAVSQCQLTIAAQPITTSVVTEALKEGSKNITKIITGTVAAACVAGAVLLGTALGGTPTEEAVPIVETHVEGSILFAGDEGGGVGTGSYSHVNPRQARLQIDSSDGEILILDWRIEEIASGVILHSGNGGDVGEILSQMLDGGEYGEYKLLFRVQDENGSTFLLGSNFFFEPTI